MSCKPTLSGHVSGNELLVLLGWISLQLFLPSIYFTERCAKQHRTSPHTCGLLKCKSDMAAQPEQIEYPLVTWKETDASGIIFDITPPKSIQFHWNGKGETYTYLEAYISEKVYPWLRLSLISAMLQIDNILMKLDNMLLSTQSWCQCTIA